MNDTNYEEFSNPRLVALYDVLNPLGADSEFFCRQAKALKATSIIDLGCGTGLLTTEMARRGHRMIGIDPSAAMLGVARARPDAGKVTWLQGSHEKMAHLNADMVLMTSHVAQFFLGDSDWHAMLNAAHNSLRAGGHIVFDFRRLSSPPFPGMPVKENRRRIELDGAGAVEWWVEIPSTQSNRVRYELHYLFVKSGDEVVSVNELAFRSRQEIEQALSNARFELVQVFGDWNEGAATDDSREMNFVAMRR